MTEKNETLLELSINEDRQVGLSVRITDQKQFNTVMISLAEVAARILKGRQKESDAFVLSLIHGLNLDLNELLLIDKFSKAND